MNDDDKSSVAYWLGTNAVDGAQVGPFQLRRVKDAVQSPEAVEGYRVYLEPFESPLVVAASAAQADLATREFLSRMVACAARLRAVRTPSFSHAPSNPPPSAGSNARRRASKGKSRRKKPRLPSKGRVLGVLCLVALTCVGSYYLGTTQVPAPDSGVIVTQ